MAQILRQTIFRINLFLTSCSPNKLFMRLSTKVKVTKHCDAFLKPGCNFECDYYLVNKDSAKAIAEVIKPYLTKGAPVIEVNPGYGLLTKELIECQENHIYLFEKSEGFTYYFDKLKMNYPHRFTYKIGNFYSLRRHELMDSTKEGNFLKNLLSDLKTEDKNRVVKVIGPNPSTSFIYYLLNIATLQSTRINLGKLELFFIMPEPQYQIWKQNTKKSLPVILRLFFNIALLKQLPACHFQPLNMTRKPKKGIEYFCLVHVENKRLPCPPEYLNLIVYFFLPHTFPPKAKIIQKLEYWIPGSGIWLITGQDPPGTNVKLSPDKDDVRLPHMTIFTEFRDLTFEQKLTLFKRFISWPGFHDCAFRKIAEKNLPNWYFSILNIYSRDKQYSEIQQKDMK